MTYEAQLERLGLSLPPPPQPVGAYLPGVGSGNLLFISGQLPLANGTLVLAGKVGAEVTLEAAQQAARVAALNALAIVSDMVGSLDGVVRIVRVGVYVASAAGFTGQPLVANGASQLLVDIFGDQGKHARFAVGVAELPLGAPVEIEMVVEVRP